MKIADLLDELDFFQEFSYPELERIARYLGLKQVPAGELIFREGDPGNYMLILTDGSMAVLKAGENGRQVLSHESRGRIVGEMAMLDMETRSATCIAETNCELLILNSESLKKFAAEHPGLAYRFMFCLARQLSRRLRRVSGMMADFLGN
ncbi:MAG: cyclic nucleotide-binding domain-containing protein [Telluria sp.]